MVFFLSWKQQTWFGKREGIFSGHRCFVSYIHLSIACQTVHSALQISETLASIHSHITLAILTVHPVTNNRQIFSVVHFLLDQQLCSFVPAVDSDQLTRVAKNFCRFEAKCWTHFCQISAASAELSPSLSMSSNLATRAELLTCSFIDVLLNTLFGYISFYYFFRYVCFRLRKTSFA